jgi:hypothetical protein
MPHSIWLPELRIPHGIQHKPWSYRERSTVGQVHLGVTPLGIGQFGRNRLAMVQPRHRDYTRHTNDRF